MWCVSLRPVLNNPAGTLNSHLLLWSTIGLIILASSATVFAADINARLSIDLEGRYDDNIFFSVTNPTYDYLLVATPHLEVNYDSECSDFGLAAHLGYFAYKENTDQNNLDQQYHGFWHYQWSEQFQTSLDAAYVDDQRRDRIVEESGLLTEDIHRRRQDYTLEGQYSFSERTFLSASYALQYEIYDDPGIDDLISHNFMMGWYRLMGGRQRTTASCRLGYSTYEYGNTFEEDAGSGFAIEAIESERNVDSYSLSVGLDHALSETLQLNSAIGVRNTKFENELRAGNRFIQWVTTEEDDPWGFVGNFSLSYNGWKTHANVSASHDLVPASGRNGLTERTNLTLSGSWQPYAGWRLSGSTYVFLNRSDQSGATVDIDELTTIVSGMIAHTFNRYWHVGMRYSYYRIDNRQNDTEGSRNRVGLEVGWNWPVIE